MNKYVEPLRGKATKPYLRIKGSLLVKLQEIKSEHEKNKDDKTSKEFYYLGKIKATGKTHQFVMNNTSKTAVEIEYNLVTPVQEDIYDYITN